MFQSILGENRHWQVCRVYYTPGAILSTCQALVPLQHRAPRSRYHVGLMSDEKIEAQREVKLLSQCYTASRRQS